LDCGTIADGVSTHRGELSEGASMRRFSTIAGTDPFLTPSRHACSAGGFALPRLRATGRQFGVFVSGSRWRFR
jgi:hypothetical protein